MATSAIGKGGSSPRSILPAISCPRSRAIFSMALPIFPYPIKRIFISQICVNLRNLRDKFTKLKSKPNDQGKPRTFSHHAVLEYSGFEVRLQFGIEVKLLQMRVDMGIDHLQNVHQTGENQKVIALASRLINNGPELGCV